MTNTSKLPEIRLLITLQVVCAASAIASLPRGLIDPLWLFAFILPAAFFLFLSTGRRRRYLPIWLAFAGAAITQGVAAYLAYLLFGPLDEKSSLACSLLPALTFFTLRREPADTSLSLFLSFCFLLIGIMLNHDAADWTLLVFLSACAWALQIEASNRALTRRHAARGRMMSMGARILRRSQVVAALMMVALLVYQGISLIPSPGRSTSRKASGSAASHGGRALGLNSKFDLSGGEGSPLNLTSSKVIRVTDPTGSQVPSDLYLRMTYFDHAIDQEEWITQTPSYQQGQVNPRGFSVHESIPRLPRKQILVTRLEPAAEGEIFLPPRTIRIAGLSQLQFHRTTEHFRSPDPSEMGYQVLYQRPHKLPRLGRINRQIATRRLTMLPPGLRTPEIVKLARKWAGPRPKARRPMEVARQIAAELETRCRYTLKEPSGPYNHPLHNFLFGENEGYCMHFATALAVMLRINGIPCRIGVGFHSGDAEPKGARVFGSQHAHAWVELPLEKTAWTLIDPTPADDRTRRGWPDPQLANQADQGPDGAGSGAFGGSCFLAGLQDPLANLGAFLSLALVLIALTIGLIVLAVRRSRETSQRATSTRPTPDSVKARRMLDQILQVLAKCGHPKHHRATLEQYLGYLRGEESLDHPVMAGAFRAYQDVRFGAKRLDEDREESMVAAIAVAKKVQM